MNVYLERYKYSNTLTEDLWGALAGASGKNIEEMMSTWTLQMGFPVLKVSAEQKGTSRVLTISQSKFCADGPMEGIVLNLCMYFQLNAYVTLVCLLMCVALSFSLWERLC